MILLACRKCGRGTRDSGPHQDTPVEASATMTPRVASIAHLQMRYMLSTPKGPIIELRAHAPCHR